MWLIPTKKQFKDWSLPSKVTYISFWFGLISILYIVLIHFTDESISKKDIKELPQKKEIQEIRELLTAKMGEIQRQRENEFLKYYDLGYQLVAFDRFNNVVPSSSRLRFDFKINWDETEIELDDNGYVHIKLPQIDELRTGKHMRSNYLEFKYGYIGPLKGFTLDKFRVGAEVIDYDYYGYICIIGLHTVLYSK
jgi:hypothetical protein